MLAYDPIEINHSTSVSFIKSISYGLVCLFACTTFTTHIAQIMRLTFNNYAVLSLTAVGLTFIGVAIFVKRWLIEITVKDTKIFLTLLLIGLFGSTLAVVINRPDIDDMIYVPNIIHYLAKPDENMGQNVHFIYNNNVPITSSMSSSQPYEYTQSIISYYTRINFLAVYYCIMPAIVGFFIVLSLFYEISLFSSNTRNALIGTMFTIGIVLILGETHRAFGNISFARAFQGKFFLLTVGIPLFVSFSIDFFREPSVRNWLPVFVTATAMSGATTTAIPMLPALASVLAIANIYTEKNLKHNLLCYGFYFLSLWYVILYGAVILSYAIKNLGVNASVNEGWPTTFYGHLQFFVNPQLPVTPIVAITATIVSLIFLTGSRRKFLLVWIVASIVLFLNPLTAPLVIQKITSPNIYWRLFYILPFPLVIGTSVSAIFERRFNQPGNKRIVAIVMGILAIALSNLLLFKGISVSS